MGRREREKDRDMEVSLGYFKDFWGKKIIFASFKKEKILSEILGSHGVG